MSSNAYCEPCAPATWIVRPATSTLNKGADAISGRPIPTQFLHELDDLGALLEEDFAELLDFALLLDFGAELLLDFREELLVDTLVELELDCGVTLEEDFAELLDGGVTLELDCGALEELELYLPK